MTFKEFLTNNNHLISSDEPFYYIGMQLENVTVSDMERFKAIQNFLKLPKNENLTSKQLLNMLKDCPQYLKSITKYPRNFEDFFKQIKQNGAPYIALAISEDCKISKLTKQTNQKWEKITKKQDRVLGRSIKMRTPPQSPENNL